MTSAVPTIETERLRLRGWRNEDVEPFAALFQDEDTPRFLGGSGSYPQAWRTAATEAGHWVLRGYGAWAVEQRESHAFVGCVGIWHPGEWPEQELSWHVVPSRRSHGFATEAAIASRKYAYDTLGMTTLVSYIAPENAPSIRVAERLGCKRDGEVDLSGKTRLVFRHPSPQAAQ
ncbi:MAG: GNAT family N-acetyltransferase [Pseudomonadota bacterium]